MDDEERERARKLMLLQYATAESALLNQPQTPDVIRVLTDLRRSRDSLAGVEVIVRGVSEEWRQSRLAEIDELERNGVAIAAATEDDKWLADFVAKIETLRMNVLAARGVDELDES